MSFLIPCLPLIFVAIAAVVYGTAYMESNYG